MEGSGLRGAEPRLREASRHDVLLHAESGDEEAVNDVLRRHRQPHVLPDRHVQRVDLPHALGMLKLPHPLLADRIELQGVGRRPGQREIEPRAPHEHHHHQRERDRRPDDLEQDRSPAVPVRALAPLQRRRADLLRRRSAFSVVDGEVQDERGDQHREEAADRHHEEEEQIHARGDARRLIGNEEQELAHETFRCALSCRS